MRDSMDHEVDRAQVGASSTLVVEALAPAAPVPLPTDALVVGHAEDRAEANADRMADAALRRLAAGRDVSSSPHDRLPHRHDPGCGHLRRSVDSSAPAAVVGRAGGTLDGTTSTAIESKRGGGRPLGAPVLQRMQAAFSADFSRVRVHDDPDAARLNRMVSARAFTTGNDLFFGAGEYAPTTREGERVLAHELAHTLQPATGPVGAVARTIRRAGDKVAFDKLPNDALGGEDAELSGLIEKAIAAHKHLKGQAKDAIEKKKDDEINAVDDRRVSKDVAQKARVAVLKKWYTAYQQTGWNLERLKTEILDATGARVSFDETNPSSIGIVGKKSSVRLFNIVGGDARFTNLGGRVATKKGTTKEYLQDARGVYISRYAHRGCSIEQMKQLFTKKVMLPRNPSDEVGTQGERFEFGGRGEHDRITPQERDFLQQRDGSGGNQRMLSVTHTKPSRKVHSNHGELFGSEAIIKIDLSLVPQNDIFNLHSQETHADKVSLPQIRPDEDGTGAKVVPADKELQSYIYSAEKNRETVLLSIPLGAVVSVKTPEGRELDREEARNRYEQFYAVNQRLKREEEDRLAKEAAAEEERRAQARAKKEGTKDKQQAVEDRADQVKDRVEAMARNAKNKKLAKWNDFDLWDALSDTKPAVWLKLVGDTAINDITVEQAKKVLEYAESL